MAAQEAAYAGVIEHSLASLPRYCKNLYSTEGDTSDALSMYCRAADQSPMCTIYSEASGRSSKYVSVGDAVGASIRRNETLAERHKGSSAPGRSDGFFPVHKLALPLTSFPVPDHGQSYMQALECELEKDQKECGEYAASLSMDAETVDAEPTDPSCVPVPYNELKCPDLDEIYHWLFDRTFSTDQAKLGYDRMYCQAEQHAYERAYLYMKHLSMMGIHKPHSLMYPLPLVGAQAAQWIFRVFFGHLPKSFIASARPINEFIELAWDKAIAVSSFVHRPSFNPDSCHPTLVIALVVLGMALSTCDTVRTAARSVFHSVFLWTYRAVKDTDSGFPDETRFTAQGIGYYQAFALLLLYEPTIMGAAPKKEQPRLFSQMKIGRCALSRLFWKLCTSLKPVNKFSSLAKRQKATRELYYATLTGNSYIFHRGADTEVQWHEWVNYESITRLLHYLFFYETLRSLKCRSKEGLLLRKMSLSNMSVMVPSPEPFWNALSPDEFFFIVSPSQTIVYVQYLGMLKSLMQFPRFLSAPPPSQLYKSSDSDTRKHILSALGLMSLGVGITVVLNQVSGIFRHGIFLINTICGSIPWDFAERDPPFLDRMLQMRLYRAVDMWCSSFKYYHADLEFLHFPLSKNAKPLILMPANQLLFSSDGEHKVCVNAVLMNVYRLSMFMLCHEDFKIVSEVMVHLRKWLTPKAAGDQMTERALTDNLFIPLYVRWIKTAEAGTMLYSACSLLMMVRITTGIKDSSMFYNPFISAMIYAAAVIMWIQGIAKTNVRAERPESTIYLRKYDVNIAEDFAFFNDANEYLQHIARSTIFGRGQPTNITDDSMEARLPAVIMMSACMLKTRPATDPLVDILIDLTCAIDPNLSKATACKIRDASLTYSNRRTSLS